MKELQIVRRAILTALDKYPDYAFSNPSQAAQAVAGSVRLGRLDPGQWAPESLIIAHTEGGLPNPECHEFWDRVTKIANKNGCELSWWDVTHFSVGFFQEVKIAPDVDDLIAKVVKNSADDMRFQIENGLEYNNISSPIEQLFYVAWEASRKNFERDQSSPEYGLGRYVLYPQYPVHRSTDEAYLIDFAVMLFDPEKYSELCSEWSDRQDPYSDGNWVCDPHPTPRDKECNVNLKLAIECDSYKHHARDLTPSEFEYMKRRERFLQQEGWTVLAFSGSELCRNPIGCMQEVRKHIRLLHRSRSCAPKS